MQSTLLCGADGLVCLHFSRQLAALSTFALVPPALGVHGHAGHCTICLGCCTALQLTVMLHEIRMGGECSLVYGFLYL
jgi:hypothetical protein